MSKSIPRTTPLRQSMFDDMRMRKLGEKTQAGCARAVKNLPAYLKRPPDTATVDELRQYQLHMVDSGKTPQSLNAALSGLRFFFEITLERPELMVKMTTVLMPRKRQVVFSREEVSRLIAAASNLKHQTALSVAYATGLRTSEVCSRPLAVDQRTWGNVRFRGETDH